MPSSVVKGPCIFLIAPHANRHHPCCQLQMSQAPAQPKGTFDASHFLNCCMYLNNVLTYQAQRKHTWTQTFALAGQSCPMSSAALLSSSLSLVSCERSTIITCEKLPAREGDTPGFRSRALSLTGVQCVLVSEACKSASRLPQSLSLPNRAAVTAREALGTLPLGCYLSSPETSHPKRRRIRQVFGRCTASCTQYECENTRSHSLASVKRRKNSFSTSGHRRACS